MMRRDVHIRRLANRPRRPIHQSLLTVREMPFCLCAGEIGSQLRVRMMLRGVSVCVSAAAEAEEFAAEEGEEGAEGGQAGDDDAAEVLDAVGDGVRG